MRLWMVTIERFALRFHSKSITRQLTFKAPSSISWRIHTVEWKQKRLESSTSQQVRTRQSPSAKKKIA